MFKLIDSHGNEVNYYPESIMSESSEHEKSPVVKEDKRKLSNPKFIGFLEEASNEDESSDEDHHLLSEEEKAKKFLRKIHEF